MLTGSELKFDIWKEVADHTNWNKYIEYFRREPNFSIERSKDLETFYLFLKKELGKEFLSKPYKDGRDLVNSWLWSQGARYSELKWLYHSLKHFKEEECNYVKLIGKLRSVDKCNSEGIPFIIVGDSLRKAGFNVVFEPKTDYRSNPDLKITNSEKGEILYGEISQQEESNKIGLIKETYHFLFKYFHYQAPFVRFSAKIHNYASGEELVKLGKQILFMKQKAAKEESLIIIQKEETNGIIEFAIAHEKRLKDLENLQITKRYKLDTVEGQGFSLDYSSRVLSKVKDKIKQHATFVPLIIYIPLDQLYFMMGLWDIDSLVKDIKRTLEPFSNVFGVCLFVHTGEESKYFKEISDLVFFERKMVFDNYMQFVTLFVKNPDFKGGTGITEDTTKKIYSSLETMCE